MEKNEKVKGPKKEEEKKMAAPEKTQEEYLNQIMSDEAKNTAPPRTPIDVHFRSTQPKFQRPPSSNSSVTAGSAIDSGQN